METGFTIHNKQRVKFWGTEVYSRTHGAGIPPGTTRTGRMCQPQNYTHLPTLFEIKTEGEIICCDRYAKYLMNFSTGVLEVILVGCVGGALCIGWMGRSIISPIVYRGGSICGTVKSVATKIRSPGNEHYKFLC